MNDENQLNSVNSDVIVTPVNPEMSSVPPVDVAPVSDVTPVVESVSVVPETPVVEVQPAAQAPSVPVVQSEPVVGAIPAVNNVPTSGTGVTPSGNGETKKGLPVGLFCWRSCFNNSNYTFCFKTIWWR